MIFLFYTRDRVILWASESLTSSTGNIQRYMFRRWKVWQSQGLSCLAQAYIWKCEESIFFPRTSCSGVHNIHPVPYDFRQSVLWNHVRKLSLEPDSALSSWNVIHSSFICSVCFNTCKITVYCTHTRVIVHVLQNSFLAFFFKGSSYPWPLHVGGSLWTQSKHVNHNWVISLCPSLGNA